MGTPAACLVELVDFCADLDVTLECGLRLMWGETWPERSLFRAITTVLKQRWKLC